MKAATVVGLTLCLIAISVHGQSFINRLLRGGGGRGLFGRDQGRRSGRNRFGNLGGRFFSQGSLEGNIFGRRGRGGRDRDFFGRGGRFGGGFGIGGETEINERSFERSLFEEDERESDRAGADVELLDRQAAEEESQTESRFRENDDIQFGLLEEDRSYTDLDFEDRDRQRDRFALQLEQENEIDRGTRLSFNTGSQEEREVLLEQDTDLEREDISASREAEQSETEIEAEVIQERDREAAQRDEEERESELSEIDIN